MRQILVELDDRDHALLRAIALAAGVPRVQILRWALRLYALRGPWTTTVVDRHAAIGDDPLVTGPHREGVL